MNPPDMVESTIRKGNIWKARTSFHNSRATNRRAHTLKKFTKAGSSGTSAVLEAVDDDGSKGPSITAMVGTASSSSNSLQ